MRYSNLSSQLTVRIIVTRKTHRAHQLCSKPVNGVGEETNPGRGDPFESFTDLVLVKTTRRPTNINPLPLEEFGAKAFHIDEDEQVIDFFFSEN